MSQATFRDWFSSSSLAFSCSFRSYSLRRRWSWRTRRSRLRISSYPSIEQPRYTIIFCSESVRMVPGCKIDVSCRDSSSLRHSSCFICLEISSRLRSFRRSNSERRGSPESSASTDESKPTNFFIDISSGLLHLQEMIIGRYHLASSLLFQKRFLFLNSILEKYIVPIGWSH